MCKSGGKVGAHVWDRRRQTCNLAWRTSFARPRPRSRYTIPDPERRLYVTDQCALRSRSQCRVAEVSRVLLKLARNPSPNAAATTLKVETSSFVPRRIYGISRAEPRNLHLGESTSAPAHFSRFELILALEGAEVPRI